MYDNGISGSMGIINISLQSQVYKTSCQLLMKDNSKLYFSLFPVYILYS
jgi:hypothetical protein